MPIKLEGSCRCGAVSFSADSHTPQPYQLCYCSVCRKTAGGGGFAINLGADARTLRVQGRDAVGVFRAEIAEDGGACRTGTGERNFCTLCGSALWLYDPTWPDHVHPLASAIDSDLPEPPERVHMMLGSKADWVEPAIGRHDMTFDAYPEQSLEEWHRSRGLWVA